MERFKRIAPPTKYKKQGSIIVFVHFSHILIGSRPWDQDKQILREKSSPKMGSNSESAHSEASSTISCMGSKRRLQRLPDRRVYKTLPHCAPAALCPAGQSSVREPIGQILLKSHIKFIKGPVKRPVEIHETQRNS